MIKKPQDQYTTKEQPNPLLPKIVVLVGPTASGKSELAVKLAKRFHGEIISCDSRQIYQGLDLGTGKVPGNWEERPILNNSGRKRAHSVFCYKNIPHHLIDFVNPRRRYSAAQFQKQAQKTIAGILKQGRLPILCGGTAHWIDTVVYNQQLPDVKPDQKLRTKLEKKSTEQLFTTLKKLDKTRAASIDPYNRRRLIRALEIVLTTGKPIPSHYTTLKPYNPFWIGIKTDQIKLYKKIEKRLNQRLKEGMIKEVQKLHSAALPKTKHRNRGQSLSWDRLESFGLEYKYISLYLQKKITRDEMITRLCYAIKHYSKRQMTWWRKNKDINWVSNRQQANQLISDFLKML